MDAQKGHYVPRRAITLALFLFAIAMLSPTPGIVRAQEPDCSDPAVAATNARCGAENAGQITNQPSAMVTSSSTTASSGPELQLTIYSLPSNMAVGSSIVLYLEDDFVEPDSISASDVYFVSSPQRLVTGNGARVYATTSLTLKNDDYFTADKDDIAIQVLVPDMCTNATDACEGANGLLAGDMVTLVIESDSGIKNPSEEGTHSTGYALLGPTERVSKNFTSLNTVRTLAKITLSDVGNRRGYVMTVTGFGFNNGTTASVYVLHDTAVTSDLLDNGTNEAALCERIIRNGTKVGGALVGSDDRVSVTFEVTAPAFSPGNVNYICMVDGEGRMSSTDVEDFNLEPSLRVEPRVVNTGDTATVYAQDFSNVGAAFTSLRIAGQSQAPNGVSLSTFIVSSSAIGADGSATMTFEVPSGLEGVLRLDAMWGDLNEDTKITIGTAGQEGSRPPALPADEPQFVGPVTGLTAATQGAPAGSVRLVWTPAQNAHVHFAVYIKSADVTAGNYATAQMVPFSGAEGVISGLESGIPYHFIVIGMRWNWIQYGPVWGAWSSWQTATP